MNQKRVWWLRTLLPDLPGDLRVASLRIPGPPGIQIALCRNLAVHSVYVQALRGKDEVIDARQS